MLFRILIFDHENKVVDEFVAEETLDNFGTLAWIHVEDIREDIGSDED